MGALPEHFMGEIVMFAGTYAPAGWDFCDGKLLSIGEYSALFAVIGNQYGGDGHTTFALPNLKDRFPLHRGNYYQQSMMGGSNQSQLSVNNLPAHNHKLKASSNTETITGSSVDPTNNVMAKTGREEIYTSFPSGENLVEMNDGSIETVGGGQAFNNMPPYLTLNFIICLDGLFPSRN